MRMRTKAELRNILFRYLDEYYREFPEEKGNYPNWGELEWDDRYPDVFPALYGSGDLSQEETDELNNFADKVYDAWRKLNESTKNNRHIESKLAESFANELKNLQKKGLFENVSSFDLNFNGKGINIKLNESQPGNRNASFKKRSNLKENETDEVTYMQDFSIEGYGDTSEAEEAAAELGIDLTFYEGTGNLGMDEICASASSEEVLKEFLYDWGFIESYSDFEDGLD